MRTAVLVSAVLVAVSCGGNGADGVDAAPDPGPDAAAEVCDLPAHEDDIVLSTGDSVDVGAHALRLVQVGDAVVACGDGFMAGAPAASPGTVTTTSLTEACTGLAAAGSDRAVVVTREGTVSLWSVASDGQVAALDSTTRAGSAFYDVAIDGDRAVVAGGSDGVLVYSIAGDSVTDAGSLSGGSDARGVAMVGSEVLVADGTNGAVLIDGGGGGAIASLGGDGVARRVVVDGNRAVILRGVHGYDQADVTESSLSLAASQETQGVVLDAVFVGVDELLVVEGAYLARDRFATDGTIERVSIEDRPDAGDMVGSWFRAAAKVTGGTWVAIGDDLTPVTFGAGLAAPEIAVETTGVTMWADPGEGDQALFIVDNVGTEDMVLTDATAEDPFQAVVFNPSSLTQREGCSGQFIIAPGGRFLVSLGFVADTADPVAATFTIHSSDPDELALALTVEGNRPALEVGDPAPDFSLLTLDGDELRLSDHAGKIVLLKLYDAT